ncbi:MAG: hypothetical protein PVI97_15805 [Candidatus Thiodiazotropha sp.]|jgi:hypothetical protein
MFSYSGLTSGPVARIKRHFWVFLSPWLLWMISTACHADRDNWLELESGNYKIFKRYGLPEGERLTMTLFPPVRYEPGLTLQLFYQLIDEDLPRAGIVADNYQTEIMEAYGLSVIFTLRRYRNHTGAQSLVYYQGFYRPGQNRMWFVRTDLNDDLALLIKHYKEELDIILDWMSVENPEG